MDKDKIQHKELAAGRWAEMPLALQMLNIGSEISRANRWKSKGNQNQVERAVFRALELIVYNSTGELIQRDFDMFMPGAKKTI